MNFVGRKIYYELTTGNIILSTGEMQGSVIETTLDQDFESYQVLKERIKESIGIIHLQYGELNNEFMTCTGYRVDITKSIIDKNAIVFSYTNPETKLKEVKNKQKQIISDICNLVIESGFNSNAYQGIQKTYNSTLADQTNIIGLAFAASSKMAGTPGCENDVFYYHAKGEDFLEYTITECLQLARDMKIFIEVQLFKSKLLQNYIDTLMTVEKVQAVTWDTEVLKS
jgi:hypothetical protein